MSAPELIEIRRYPVKSMLGETLQSTFLGEKGIPGDRAWATRDEKRGGIRGAKQIPQLMRFQARHMDDAAPLITAPDGESCAASAQDVNQWLSVKLDHPVTLWPILPADNVEHYRRGAPDNEDFEQELRTVFGRLPGEPLPDLSEFAELLEFESPPGTYFDAFPLMLMSRQSLATLTAAAPNSKFDVRRFRPNLLLDFPEGTGAYPEQALVGKVLRLGDAVLEVVSTCPRCSMTTHATAELPRDTDIMRHLVQQTGGNLGIYARVVEPGHAQAGQILETD